MGNEISAQLERLAQSLAYNHAVLSIEGANNKEIKDYLGSGFSCPPRSRVVVVVGAGASMAACGLQSGIAAAEAIQKKLRVNPSLVKNELDRLRRVYKLDPANFETRLLALSKFNPRELVRYLQEEFDHRYYPSLTYEILSHLMKHRFVDAIVNFNFDELLDQALDDELGEGGYYGIVSDGECPDDLADIMDDSLVRFRLPLYIKPHGTAGSRSTMRFTGEDYFLLPSEMQRVLEKLFSDLPVRLIVIGFAMQSFEFNEIITRKEFTRRRQSELYVINKEPLVSGDVTLQSLGMSRYFFRVTKRETLDTWLERIWSSTTKQFPSGRQPRMVARHKLICDLFSRKNLDPNPKRISYLRSRMLVEIALEIAKAKGFVNLPQMARSRAGKYFRLLRAAYPRERRTLFEFCEFLGLTRWMHSHSREAMRLRGGKSGALRRLIIEETEFETQCLPLLLKALEKKHKSIRRARKKFKYTMLQMYKNDEMEIYSTRESTYHVMFKSPTVLPTLTALKHRTRQLVRKRWDKMFCVAETGEWLFKDRDVRETIRGKQGKHKLVVIVADTTHKETLKKKFGNGVVEVHWLPWWLHNQHVTIFMSGRKYIGCVGFTRRLRESSVRNPICLRDPGGCKVAFEAFVAYLLKAKTRGYITRKLLDAKKKELLDMDP